MGRVIVGTDAYLGVVDMDTGDVRKLHEGSGPYVGVTWDAERIYAVTEASRILAFDAGGKKVRDFGIDITEPRCALWADGTLLIGYDGGVLSVETKGRGRDKMDVSGDVVYISRDGDGLAVLVGRAHSDVVLYRIKSIDDLDLVEPQSLNSSVNTVAVRGESVTTLSDDGYYGPAGRESKVVESASSMAVYGRTTIIAALLKPELVTIRRGAKISTVTLDATGSIHIVRGVGRPDIAHHWTDGPACPLA